MPQVQSLSVSGYKSICELKDFKLDNLNVLIGANGAGKSNFIGLFRLLNEMYNEKLQVFVQTQGGPDALLHFGRKVTDKLHAEFYFEANGYKFDLVPTNDNRLIFENELSWFKGVYYPGSKSEQLGAGHSESKLKAAKDSYSQYVRPAVSSWRVYHFHDTSEKARVKQLHALNDNEVLATDACNLAAYLRMLKNEHADAYMRIVSTIRLVAPFFDDFFHRRNTKDLIELEWLQKGNPDTPLKAHLLSDGTLRFICLATVLMQPYRLQPSTILIDEPELGLHPYAITILASMLKQVAQVRQLIVSTQSVELVNELSPKDIIVVDNDKGVSSFRRFEDEPDGQSELADWLKEYSLGELWKRNILGGRP